MSKISFTHLQLAFKERDAVDLLERAIQQGLNIHKTVFISHTLLIEACYYGRSRCVELLLKQGADPDVVNFFGHTALFYAIPSIECIKLLIQANADVHYTSPDQNTFLMRASEIGSLEAIQYFLEAGLDPLSTDKKGRNASQIARENGYLDVADFIDNYFQPIKSALEFADY